MDENAIRKLKRAHRFEEWYDRNTLRESLFVRDFFFAEGTLEGWNLQRATPILVPGAPPHVQSLWTPASDAADTLLRLDVYECESRGSAHEFLIRLVGQFQTTGVTWREDVDLGDVSFTSATQGGLAFTRGNLVFFLAGVGRTPLPVLAIAKHLDDRLRAKPSGRQVTRRAVSGARARLRQSARGGKAKLEIEDDPKATTMQQRTYQKIFTGTGEVRVEEGELVYEPTRPGPTEVDVFIIDSQGNVEHQTIDES